MTLRSLGLPLSRVFFRTLHLSAPKCGADAREKRQGHIKKTDYVEGERASIGVSHSAYELIDENLMDKVIDNMKFKDIPVVHILCTRNNTKIVLVSSNGKIESVKSAGTEGYKNCRKGTTVAAQAVANRVVSNARDLDINMIRLVFRGLGPGRGAAYKVFELSGLKVVSLSDRTDAQEPWKYRPRAAKSL